MTVRKNPRTLEINHCPVRIDDAGYISLTDLKTAAGDASRLNPHNWVRQVKVQQRIAEIEKVESMPAVVTQKGPSAYAGTFAHPALAEFYCDWISFEFGLLARPYLRKLRPNSRITAKTISEAKAVLPISTGRKKAKQAEQSDQPAPEMHIFSIAAAARLLDIRLYAMRKLLTALGWVLYNGDRFTPSPDAVEKGYVIKSRTVSGIIRSPEITWSALPILVRHLHPGLSKEGCAKWLYARAKAVNLSFPIANLPDGIDSDII